MVDDDGKLAGIFTDSDLARLFENHLVIDRPIAESMTRDPLRITAGSEASDAVELMQSRKISELPVVDDPGGLIDVTDLIGLVPAEALQEG
ncbi:MAG: CBS domain-containing protein [Isosphaeraceae bacterium]